MACFLARDQDAWALIYHEVANQVSNEYTCYAQTRTYKSSGWHPMTQWSVWNRYNHTLKHAFVSESCRLLCRHKTFSSWWSMNEQAYFHRIATRKQLQISQNHSFEVGLNSVYTKLKFLQLSFHVPSRHHWRLSGPSSIDTKKPTLTVRKEYWEAQGNNKRSRTIPGKTLDMGSRTCQLDE